MPEARRHRSIRPVSILSAASLFVALAVAYKGVGHARVTAAPPAAESAPATQTQPSTAQLIGMEAIDQRLGDKSPTGRHIVVGHVEGGEPDTYLPLTTAHQFEGVHFIIPSGPGKVSSHATATATVIYGPKGLAPGVTDVHLFSVNQWFTGGCLHVDQMTPADPGDIRVFNHSWISDAPNNALLDRVDDLIEQRDVVMVVGTNNGANKSVPPVLASAYNVISVGEWDGNSSGGYTWVDGVGRCKPEIVAPGSRTSFATPVITAAVARLLETADAMPAAAQARKPAVIKAVLLAGADKPPGWNPAPGKPLDNHLGAGRLRFDHSYDMLVAGPVAPEKPTPGPGWDYRALKPKASTHYILQLDHPASVSIILTWNRKIEGQKVTDFLTRRVRWDVRPRVADMDLTLLTDEAGGAGRELAASRSNVDNIEHVYRAQLPAGRYRIDVTRKDELAEDWNYAVAWHVDAPAAQAAETPKPPTPTPK